MASTSGSSISNKPPPTPTDRRLFVGNLASNVDEYTLMTLFSRHGKITSLDFLFHRNGPLKGKPRGYAFVEYSTPKEALKAMAELHNHLLRGRKINVLPSNEAPPINRDGGPRKWRRSEARPTTLSLIKGQHEARGTTAKISALEAKLASLASSPFASSSTLPHNESESVAVQPEPESTSSINSLLRPDSLPARPAILMPEAIIPPVGVSDFDSAEAIRLDRARRRANE